MLISFTLLIGVDADSAPPPMPSFDDHLEVTDQLDSNDHNCHVEEDSESTSDDDNISGTVQKEDFV